ncbi:TPA: ABC-three component system protein [Streptococcus suis]
MNEMTLSSLIQIMQDGFIQHDKQESAGRFLLESVTIQEDSLCTTDLNSKKISRLVSRKDPVPDDIKQVTSKQYKAINAINRIELEAEIRAAIEGLISINLSDVLPQLEYVALRIDQKISDALLMNDVRNHVLQYYRYIETIFSEMTDVFDDIAGEVKLSSQKLEKAGLSQEDVIYNLTEWIHNKVFAGDTKGKMACRIVVCFFIQNCEVFYKNEISK